MTKPARGERNNNPGNIDYNPRNKWKGLVGIETEVLTLDSVSLSRLSMASEQFIN